MPGDTDSSWIPGFDPDSEENPERAPIICSQGEL